MTLRPQEYTSQVTMLDPAAYRRTPWKNGGGITIDIAEAMLPGFAPGSWDGMIWRFGRTSIVAPGPFSDLGGFDRRQALVAGQGLVLVTPDGEIDVRQPFKPVRFKGETPISSRLESGPVDVVNLIGNRTLVSMDLACVAAGSELSCAAGTHIVYAAGTTTHITINGDDWELGAGHAVRIDADTKLIIAGKSGTVVVASIFPV